MSKKYKARSAFWDVALGNNSKLANLAKLAIAEVEKLEQDEVDIRSRLYQRIHELETQLEQRSDEPVAWMNEEGAVVTDWKWATVQNYKTPLFNKPQQHKPWVSLSDEEIRKLCVTTYSGYEFSRLVESKLRELNEAPPQRKQMKDWIDPNDKTQDRFLPDIGEPVLFCHEGKTYYGKHGGGSFMCGSGIKKKHFNTWECHWMPVPAAHGIKEKNT